MRYYVVMVTPWYVRNVGSLEDACNVAVAEVAKRVPHYVDVEVAHQRCECGRREKAVLMVAGDALVAVLLGLKVKADSREGAERVAKSVIGKCIPTNLKTVEILSLDGGEP